MKKIVIAVVALLTFSFSNAQETAKKIKAPVKVIKNGSSSTKVKGAGMLFDSETIDYGSVPADSDGKREFVFVNNGNKPLIITNATGSCGCTVPTFSKEPIMPGKKGVIGVQYDTARAGQPFSKTVTITSNAEGTPTKVLNIKGTVLPREEKKS